MQMHHTQTSVISPLARAAMLKSVSSSPILALLTGGASESRSKSELGRKEGREERERGEGERVCEVRGVKRRRAGRGREQGCEGRERE